MHCSRIRRPDEAHRIGTSCECQWVRSMGSLTKFDHVVHGWKFTSHSSGRDRLWLSFPTRSVSTVHPTEEVDFYWLYYRCCPSRGKDKHVTHIQQQLNRQQHLHHP